MRALTRSLVLASFAAFALVAASPSARADATVTVGHNRLDPKEIKIKKGESVTFHNVEEMPGGHTIAADDGSWQSGPLKLDESYTHKFEQSGTVKIHIVQHPKATAVIVVE